MERVSGFSRAIAGADLGAAPTAAAPVASGARPGAGVAVSLLPAPEPCALADDRGAALAILWVKTLTEDRTTARRAAAAAERRIEAANRREIDERRAVARDEYLAARTTALSGVVGGIASAAGSFSQASAGGEGGTAIVSQGRLFEDLGALAATERGRAADDHELTASEAQQRGEAAVRAYEQCTDDASRFDGDVARVLDLLRDLLGAERGAESAAIVRG